MVKPFQFARLPLIYFGAGKITLLPGVIKSFGSSVLLVTGRNSFSQTVQYKYLTDTFCKERIKYKLLVVSGEPSPQVINEIVRDPANRESELVVSIGGGSVIDAGKAVSAMFFRNESIIEFLEGIGTREHPGTKLPFIAVPTTSGTGSEATKNAVISSVGKMGFKRSLRHDNFVPDIAIIDPELTLGCPADITAASGMDCFTQLTEAYLSDKSNSYTDALALEGLKAVKQSLIRSYQHGDDLEARTGMSFAALTSGICLANAGLGAVHGFASSVGGMYNIPHGVICGTLMAATNEINVRELRKGSISGPALKKYATLGRLFIDEEGRSDDYYIEAYIEYLYYLTGKLKLPGLGEFGINRKEIDEICSATESKNNPVKLNKEELIEIISGRI